MYNEKEIKKILSRAYQLQHRLEGALHNEESNQELTLEEIEEIAKDSGVSPEYVRQAAIEFEGIPIEEPLFLETEHSYEVELIGFAKGELDKKTWAELRAIIEYHFDSPGKVTKRPNGIVWNAKPKGILKFLHTRKSPTIEISTSGNKTTFRIKQSLKTFQRLMYPAYLGLASAAVLVGISIMEGPEGLFFSAGSLVIAKLFQLWSNRKKRNAREQLKEAMEQLQTIVTRRHTAAAESESDREKTQIIIPEGDEEATGQSHTDSLHKKVVN